MPIDIDGLAVLRVIGANPKLFPTAAAEINNFVRKYVTGQLNPITMDIERLRDIYSAIGGEAFVLILDGQAHPASASLAKKLDKENPALKTASSDWLRRRIVELASGTAEPAKKPQKTPKKEPTGKKPTVTPEQKELAAGLKSKTIDLQKARALWLNTSETSFNLVLARLTGKQLLGLAKKLDKDNPDLPAATPDQLCQRIADLAKCATEPVFKNIIESKAMAATRTRMSRAR